jgi:hypothetical protein
LLQSFKDYKFGSYNILKLLYAQTLKDPPDASLSNIPVVSVSRFAFNVVLPQHTGVKGLEGSRGGVCVSLLITNRVSLFPLIYNNKCLLIQFHRYYVDIILNL